MYGTSKKISPAIEPTHRPFIRSTHQHRFSTHLPELETLEDRCTPSITFPIQGNSGKILQSLPLQFQANHGQAHEAVQYVARGQGYQVFLAANQAVIALPNSQTGTPELIRLSLLGASQTALGRGSQQIGQSNYLIGTNSSSWLTGIPDYAQVRFNDVYANIDVVYHGNNNRLEYDFVVDAGADPRLIVMDLEGGNSYRLDAQGNLLVGVGDAEVRLQAPVAYQWVGGQRRAVNCSFLIEESTIRFQVGAYDVHRALVIDPILTHSQFLGGANDDYGRAIQAQSTPAIYFVGDTGSYENTLYLSQYAFDRTYNGPPPSSAPGGFATGDIFVRKITNSYVYSTYLGGSGNDFAEDVTVDQYGSVYITGHTMSINFPMVRAYQRTYGGGGSGRMGDAFLAKLNPSGSGLLFSTYLGGSGEDKAQGISRDSQGRLYITGQTDSSNLPVKNAYQSSISAPGHTNAFIASFTSSGVARFVTYFGNYVTKGTGIAATSKGNIYVTGTGTVPTTPGAYNTSAGSSWVSKFDSTATNLIYSTFLTGCVTSAIGFDQLGNAYVTGTASFDFPTTSGAFQTAFGGGTGDAFVLKLNPQGSGVVYATFLGGNNMELSGRGIAVDARFGSVAVTGGTFSHDFPIVNPLSGHGSFRGGYEDVYLVRLNPSGKNVNFSTFLGGRGDERGEDICIDSRGYLYLTGWTQSSNFPTVPADQFGGSTDAFVAQVWSAPVYMQLARPKLIAHEYAGKIVLTVERNTSAGTTSVYYTTSNGTAVAGQDYRAVAGRITFSPGQTTRTITIPILDDSAVEENESFFVTLSTPWGGTTGMISTTEIVLLDNEAPPGADNLGVFRTNVWMVDGNADRTMNDPRIWFFVPNWSGARVVVGDWDGDGVDQLGLYRNGVWVQDSNSNGVYDAGVDLRVTYGSSSYLPVVGDWDGDGNDDFGLYNPNTGTWLLNDNDEDFSTSTETTENGRRFVYGGVAGDLPVAGDWDGTGSAHIGLYRSASGRFVLDRNGDHRIGGDAVVSFDGATGGIPVIGDWDGDGMDERGLFRNGTWKTDDDGNGVWGGVDRKHTYTFGAGTQPAAGNWPTPPAPGLSTLAVRSMPSSTLAVTPARENRAAPGDAALISVLDRLFGGDSVWMTGLLPLGRRWGGRGQR